VAILGGSNRPASRLYKATIANGKAVEVFCMPNSLKDDGPFMIGGVLGRGGNYDELETILMAELHKFVNEPVSEEELNRTKVGNRKATDIGTDNAMALLEQLCSAEVEDSWQRFFTYDDAFDVLTAADIQRVAKKYFNVKNLTVGRFVQEKPTNQVVAENATDGTTAAEARAAIPAESIDSNAGSDSSGQKASFKKRTVVKKLPNGLTVQICRCHSSRRLRYR